MAYRFNPSTGKWKHVADKPKPVQKKPKNSKSGSNDEGNSGSSGGGSLTSPPVLEKVPLKDGSVDSKKASEKEFVQVEYNLLKGTVDVIPTFDYETNSTINIQGIGKILSGIYSVISVKTSITTSGVTQSLEVRKNGFGETFKTRQYTGKSQLVDSTGKVLKSLDNTSTNTVVGKTTTTPKKNVTPKPEKRRTHTLTNSDTLWGLAVKYYNNGSKWRTIAKANNISDAETTRLKVGRKLIIP